MNILIKLVLCLIYSEAFFISTIDAANPIIEIKSDTNTSSTRSINEANKINLYHKSHNNNNQYINIILNVHITERNLLWKSYLIKQLGIVNKSGVLDIVNSFTVFISPTLESIDSSSSTIFQEANGEQLIREKISNKLVPLRIIEIVALNQFEYPAFLFLKHLAERYNNLQDGIFLYFHTSPMDIHSKSIKHGKKTYDPIKITYAVIYHNWQYILDQYAIHTELTTVGIAASCSGFQWYNFFWARGAYIRRLVTPIATQNTDYYLKWLGMVHSKYALNTSIIFTSMPSNTVKNMNQQDLLNMNIIFENYPNKISLCRTHGIGELDVCFEEIGMDFILTLNNYLSQNNRIPIIKPPTLYQTIDQLIINTAESVELYRLPYLKHNNMYINIIYHAAINPKNLSWKTIIAQQLTDILHSGLFNTSNSFYIFLSPSSFIYDTTSLIILKEADTLIQNIFQLFNTKTNMHTVVSIIVNLYEYPALRFLKEVANRYTNQQDSVFLYFHTKGMFFQSQQEYKGRISGKSSRSFENIQLTNIVVAYNWQYILHQYAIHTDLTTVGIAASCSGFQWYNFFWARGAYIRRLVRPIATFDRFYYEMWLSLLHKDYATNKSIPSLEQPWARLSSVNGRYANVYFENIGNKLSLCRRYPLLNRNTCFDAVNKHFFTCIYDVYRKGHK